MSENNARLLRYCLSTMFVSIVLTPLIWGVFYVLAVALMFASMSGPDTWVNRTVQGVIGFPTHRSLLVNSLCWSMLISATITLLISFLRHRSLPRFRDERTGCCRKCEYDLTGTISGICPKCGTAVPGQATEAAGAVPPEGNGQG
jgi:hypothetical protein